jgi:hypothetical protein
MIENILEHMRVKIRDFLWECKPGRKSGDRIPKNNYKRHKSF